MKYVIMHMSFFKNFIQIQHIMRAVRTPTLLLNPLQIEDIYAF